MEVESHLHQEAMGLSAWAANIVCAAHGQVQFTSMGKTQSTMGLFVACEGDSCLPLVQWLDCYLDVGHVSVCQRLR